MAKLFDVLRVLNELDTAEMEAKVECKGRLGRVNDIAEMNTRKAGDVIGMAAPKGTVMKLQNLFGQPTHAAILFLIDRKEYDRVNVELDGTRATETLDWKVYAELKEKAQKWDDLDKQLGDFYSEESESDLNEIGEAAAIAFGYL